MKKNLSCSVCYEPVFMSGCCGVLPIVACESQRAIRRTAAHRKKLTKR